MLTQLTAEAARAAVSPWTTCLSCAAGLTRSAHLPRIVPPLGALHRRRFSSSRASNATKDERARSALISATTTSPTPPSSATTSTTQSQKDEDLQSSGGGTGATRGRKRKAKEEKLSAGARESFVNKISALPSVPSTQKLHPLDVQIASFFSQHRPISISQTIPSATTNELFSSLFDTSDITKTPAIGSANAKSADVLLTLSSAVKQLNMAIMENDEDDLNSNTDETAGEAPDHTSLVPPTTENAFMRGDRSPAQAAPSKQFHVNLQALARNFRPFIPPPPPIPMSDRALVASTTVSKVVNTNTSIQSTARTPNRAWRSTLTVFEYTDLQGNQTFETHATPVTPVVEGLDKSDLSTIDRSIPSSLQRMQDRRMGRLRRVAEQMWMISVKRQRKLKMKKHKYKKLMKRTKNLRRRLDRT